MIPFCGKYLDKRNGEYIEVVAYQNSWGEDHYVATLKDGRRIGQREFEENFKFIESLDWNFGEKWYEG